MMKQTSVAIGMQTVISLKKIGMSKIEGDFDLILYLYSNENIYIYIYGI